MQACPGAERTGVVAGAGAQRSREGLTETADRGWGPWTARHICVLCLMKELTLSPPVRRAQIPFRRGIVSDTSETERGNEKSIVFQMRCVPVC